MSEHKIQSTNAIDSLDNKKELTKRVEDEETFDNFDSSPTVPRSKRLVVDLDPVPKFLKNLVEGWSPQGMIVSFKLETDPRILVHKARYSLDRYQHHLVIGNLLYVISPITYSSSAVCSLTFLPAPRVNGRLYSLPLAAQTAGSASRRGAVLWMPLQ